MQAADESGQLSEAELVSMAHLLMMSGFETTMNMIGNALVTLLVNPEQLALLRAQPELLPNAMEELVRHDSPVRASMLRFTVEDVELDGVTIPAGEYILVSNLTANHDAERFDDPDRLDLTRNTDGHLATASACTTASAPRWPGWRGGSPSSACSRASPTSSWRCPTRSCSGCRSPSSAP